MMKRIFCIIAAIALILSLAGCAMKTKANTTYTGTVSAISDDSITLTTSDGEVTIGLTANTTFGFGSFGGFGQMPEGERPERGEKPEGNFERPEGEFPMPEGGVPNFEDNEMPDFSQFPQDKMPEGMTPPEGGSFDGFGGGFGGMDFSSIPVGSAVTVTTGADKTAATISISMNFQNFGGQMPNFQN